VLEALEGSGAPGAALASLDRGSASPRESAWENLGGQLVPSRKLEELLDRAREGGIHDWTDMHAQYERLADEYPADKTAHAWAVLRLLYGEKPSASDLSRSALRDLIVLSGRVEEQVFATRAKDHSNAFRKATFRSEAEMRAVVGLPEDNAFVRKTRTDMADIRARASAFLGQ